VTPDRLTNHLTSRKHKQDALLALFPAAFLLVLSSNPIIIFNQTSTRMSRLPQVVAFVLPAWLISNRHDAKRFS